MSLGSKIRELRDQGVELWLDGERLRYRAPDGALSPSDLEELRSQKEAIIELLKHETQGSDQRPVSFNQRALWYVDQLRPGTAAYNVPSGLRIEGPLDASVLTASVNEIIRRHDVLRSSFALHEGQPVQIIQPTWTMDVPLVNLADVPNGESPDALSRFAEEHIRRPFDLAEGPLVRATLLRLAEREHVLLLAMHHTVCDAWSMGVFYRELLAIYDAFVAGTPSPLPELPLQYDAYAAWQRNRLRGSQQESLVGYWTQQLEGLQPLLDLPTDHPRPPLQSFRGASESIRLRAGLIEQLREIGQSEGATLYMTLLAAFKILLSQYTGRDDIPVGGPVGGRNSSEFEDLIGFFVNTLVLRTDLSGNPTFRELLRRVRDVTLGAYAHQDLPFEMLVDELGIERDPRYSPLVQVCFNLLPPPEKPRATSGFAATPLITHAVDAQFDLAVHLINFGPTEETSVELNYNCDLFDAKTVRLLGHRYETLLEQLATAPATRLAEIDFAKPAAPPLVKKCTDRSGEARIPLSPHQERLWFIDAFETGDVYPGSPVYHNIPLVIHLRGAVDHEALQASINAVIGRHDALKTRIVEEGEQLFQVIQQDFSCQLEIHAADGNASFDGVLEQARDVALRPFQLRGGPLVRAALFEIDRDESVLVIAIHHIVADRASTQILADDLAEMYGAASNGEAAIEPAEYQYTDYCQWQADFPVEFAESLLFYWKRQLAGKLQSLTLPEDRPRPAIHRYRGGRHAFHVESKLHEQVTALAHELRCDTSSVLLAGFKALLRRYAGHDEIVVGTTDPCRELSGAERVVGPVANLLALRSVLSADCTLRDVIVQVDSISTQARRHREMEFDKLVPALAPEQDMSRTALFDVLFQFDERQPDGLRLGSVTGSVVDLNLGYGKYDIHLVLQNTAEGLSATATYNQEILDGRTVEQMMEHYVRVLEAMIADPEQEIADIELLSEEERTRQLITWNSTSVPYPVRRTIHQLLEEQADRTPDQIAVIYNEKRLTYRQLDEQANRMANFLVSEGVRKGDLVGICVDRSIEMVVAVVAVLKTGAAYVPLDPSFPADRLSLMIEDSGASVVVTQAALEHQLQDYEGKCIEVDRDASQFAQQPSTRPQTEMNSDDVAYVIYTSGSTGKPKGVQIPHRAVVNFLESMRSKPGLSAEDVLLSVTTLSFDISVLELFLPLTTGASVVIVSREEAADGVQLGNRLNSSGATFMQATPATWRLLLEAGWEGSDQLKILCGGEAMPRDLAMQLLDRCGSLWNMYGPTETTIWSTLDRVDHGVGPVPIGRPIANTQVFVLDAKLRPVPVGVPGRLYISGDGLARGYYNRPELTAEKFIPHPLAGSGAPFAEATDSARAYDTGDIAVYRADGNLLFLGRADQQVKVNGFRIELGEIEGALAEHPDIAQAVVAAREESDGEKRLVGYVIPVAGKERNGHGSVTLESLSPNLQQHLRQTLPAYMVPSAFVLMDDFPLTPNRKVDRKRLPAPARERTHSTREYSAPSDTIELQLTKLWEKTLGVRPIGLDDNFFELGGHSLLALRIVVAIQKVYGRQLPLATLFEAPTVRHLAAVIRQENGAPSWSSLVAIRAGGAKPPFFLMHSHGGNVLEYYPLAKHLGADQPVYALQARGLNGQIVEDATIEEMAAHYLSEMKGLQPEGPYYLGGFCFGGRLALEVARQLTSAGEQVDFLAFINTRRELPDRQGGTTLLHRMWYDCLNRMDIEISNLSVLDAKAKLRYLWERCLRVKEKAHVHVEMLWETLGFRRKPDAHSVAYNLEVLGKIHHSALRNYKQPSYAGSVCLFRATRQPRGFVEQRAYGWEDVLEGHFEILDAPGLQQNMLDEPHVRVLAQKMRSCLERAQTGKVPQARTESTDTEPEDAPSAVAALCGVQVSDLTESESELVPRP